MRNDYNALKRSRFNLEMNVFLSFCANKLIISELRVWHIIHAKDNVLNIDVINHGKDKESDGFRRDIQIAPSDFFAVMNAFIYLSSHFRVMIFKVNMFEKQVCGYIHCIPYCFCNIVTYFTRPFCMLR
jgi:hypothetical protein